MSKFKISNGFTDAERPIVARLYWAAFSVKLAPLLGPTERGVGFFQQILNPNFAIVARNTQGSLIGVAGFKTAKGAMTGAGLQEVAQHYGWLGALWKGPLLSLLERDLAPDTLLMDGICVDADARGLGVGTALLHAIKEEARIRKLAHVRLDVIDSNPRAHALYLREGFVEGPAQKLGPLKYVFKFSSATSMIWST